MAMRDYVAILLVALFVMAGVTAGIASFYSLSTHNVDRYSGKVVMWSEEEYQDFKVALARDDVSIKELNLVHSDPPIIADIDVRAEKPFPYGDRYELSVGHYFIYVLGAVLAFIVTGGIGVLIGGAVAEEG